MGKHKIDRGVRIWKAIGIVPPTNQLYNETTTPKYCVVLHLTNSRAVVELLLIDSRQSE